MYRFDFWAFRLYSTRIKFQNTTLGRLIQVRWPDFNQSLQNHHPPWILKIKKCTICDKFFIHFVFQNCFRFRRMFFRAASPCTVCCVYTIASSFNILTVSICRWKKIYVKWMSHTTTNNSSRSIVENILFLFIPSFLGNHIFLKSSAVSENVCPHPSSVEHYIGKFLFQESFAF